MHLLKLPWLTHTEESRKFEVYSVTISSDGSRLASGGLDGKIRIWSTEVISQFKALSLNGSRAASNTVSASTENEIPRNMPDKAMCRPLCSMGRHTGAVTCVRFSPSGRFLASGSDDRILLIWEKEEEAVARPIAFGEQDADLEHWVARKRLVAHDNDIQDMAWAPDSSILVTVGLDRSIIIWNGNTFEKIKRYDIHQSHVKGIVFDPANKYFMTASDDRTVRIFRYHRGSGTDMTFSIEHIVTDPFKKSPLTTYFRRSSWSPDGQHIAVPNAKNGPVSSVAIINRGSWVSDISLIGHESPCEVVSFSPRLYEIKDRDNQKDNAISTVLATAGQDKKLAIWSTAKATPLIIADDICYKTITDLCWSPDGHYLYISSLDGTITVIAFEANELGMEVPLERNDNQLNRYGAGSETISLPQSVEELVMEEEQRKYRESENETRMDMLMGATASKSIVESNLSKPLSSSQISQNQLTSRSVSAAKSPTPQRVMDKLTSQRVTMTKTGKKRVAPMLISSSSSSNVTSASEQLKATLISNAAQSKKIQKDLAKATISATPYHLPRLGIQTAVSGLRNKFVQLDHLEESDEDDIDKIDHLVKRPKKVATKSQAKRNKNILYPDYLCKAVLVPRTVFPDMRSQPSIIVSFSSNKEAITKRSVIEVRNAVDYDDDYYTSSYDEDEYANLDKLVRVISNDSTGRRRFELFEQEKITHAVGYEDKFWCIATDSGILKFYTSNGALLFPPIQLGSPVAMLACSESFVTAVTTSGLLSSWNVSKRQNVLNKVSVAPILNQYSYIIDLEDKRRKSKFIKVPQILDVTLDNIDGSVFVYLDNHDVYKYSILLKCWTKQVDSWHVHNRRKLYDEHSEAQDEDYLKLAENRIYKRIKFSHSFVKNE